MIGFLLAALPAPLDWMTWGLLTGPLGLFFIGVGMTALRLTDPGPDADGF
jgi:hypothetical protein